jgi:hypothetical protein
MLLVDFPARQSLALRPLVTYRSIERKSLGGCVHHASLDLRSLSQDVVRANKGQHVPDGLDSNGPSLR